MMIVNIVATSTLLVTKKIVAQIIPTTTSVASHFLIGNNPILFIVATPARTLIIFHYTEIIMFIALD